MNVALSGVIENMSWFTANDGEHYELLGAGISRPRRVPARRRSLQWAHGHARRSRSSASRVRCPSAHVMVTASSGSIATSTGDRKCAPDLALDALDGGCSDPCACHLVGVMLDLSAESFVDGSGVRS